MAGRFTREPRNGAVAPGGWAAAKRSYAVWRLTLMAFFPSRDRRGAVAQGCFFPVAAEKGISLNTWLTITQR